MMRKAAEGAEQKDLELLKAVAQAWYAHAGNAGPTNEYDARRATRSPCGRPSRFKIEAAAAAAAAAAEAPSWNFGRSLWDSYEIVTIANKLEACSLALDEPLPSPPAPAAAEAPSWDFGRSLWDSYEIVTIANKLEACSIAFDEPLPSPPAPAAARRQGKRPRENKNSLRSLFYKANSRRFDNSGRGRDVLE